ncbi:MAG: serine hydrolase [Bacteroidales bacterium]|nr:serine hydrolase [Candidatus Latescibacterota bacterium]
MSETRTIIIRGVAMKKVSILCVILLLTGLSNCANTQDKHEVQTHRSDDSVETEAFLSSLPDTIENWMNDWNMPGLAVGIFVDGETVFMRGFGYRDREERLPVTTRTLFPIASCTKSFTALSAFILEEEGKLDLDAKIKDYLPDFQMMDKKGTKNAAIRDFLGHRSGLSPYTGIHQLTGLSREEIFQHLRYFPPQFELHGGFIYSNLGYMVAGHIVERVVGRPWELFVSESILSPIGMDNTCFTYEEMIGTDDYAVPYWNFPDFESPIKRPFEIDATLSPAGGGGGIITDIEGMMAWVRFNLGDGKAGGRQLVSQEDLNEMHSPIIDLSSALNTELNTYAGYGNGWFSEKYRGYNRVYHGGLGDGWISLVSFLPEEEIGVVVLTNLYYQHLHEALVYHIIDNLLGLSPIDHNTRELRGVKGAIDGFNAGYEAFWQQADPDKMLSRDLETYTGTYSNQLFGKVSVRLEGEELGLTFESGIHLNARHYESDTFATESEILSFSHLPIKFETSEDGIITAFTISLESSVDEFRFVR